MHVQSLQQIDTSVKCKELMEFAVDIRCTQAGIGAAFVRDLDFPPLQECTTHSGGGSRFLTRALETNLICYEVGYCYITKESDGSTTLRHRFTGLSCRLPPNVVALLLWMWRRWTTVASKRIAACTTSRLQVSTQTLGVVRISFRALAGSWRGGSPKSWGRVLTLIEESCQHWVIFSQPKFQPQLAWRPCATRRQPQTAKWRSAKQVSSADSAAGDQQIQMNVVKLGSLEILAGAWPQQKRTQRQCLTFLRGRSLTAGLPTRCCSTQSATTAATKITVRLVSTTLSHSFSVGVSMWGTVESCTGFGSCAEWVFRLGYDRVWKDEPISWNTFLSIYGPPVAHLFACSGKCFSAPWFIPCFPHEVCICSGFRWTNSFWNCILSCLCLCWKMRSVLSSFVRPEVVQTCVSPRAWASWRSWRSAWPNDTMALSCSLMCGSLCCLSPWSPMSHWRGGGRRMGPSIGASLATSVLTLWTLDRAWKFPLRRRARIHIT